MQPDYKQSYCLRFYEVIFQYESKEEKNLSPDC